MPNFGPLWTKSEPLAHQEEKIVKQFVCYCFEHTEAEIRADVLAHGGHSEILETILAAKKRGVCQCVEKHPQKR